jgi:hypothetical protein
MTGDTTTAIRAVLREHGRLAEDVATLAIREISSKSVSPPMPA